MEKAVQSKEGVLKCFRQFDNNGDGFIDRDELAAMMRSLGNAVWTPETLERLFQLADVERTGRVNVEEFVSWVWQGKIEPAVVANETSELQALRMRVAVLEAENVKLKEECARRDMENSTLKEEISDLKLQVPGHADKRAHRSKTSVALVHHKDEDQGLPEKLKAFTPLTKLHAVSALAKTAELSSAEHAVQANPDSPEAAQQLESLLQRLIGVLNTSIHHMLRTDGIVQFCLDVVEAGNRDFLTVYDSVWTFIRNNDKDGIDKYRGLVAALDCPGFGTFQRSTNIVLLYQDAARTKKVFDRVIEELLHPDSLGFAVELSIPQDLKKTSRIAEKSCLRVDAPGHADRVCDIVRCMVLVSNMDGLAQVVSKLARCKAIVMTRLKERFERDPSSGGWRDCMINLYLKEDEARHVCEIQIAHKTMLNARKGLPGHVIYSRVRNASELLEALFGCRAFGLSVTEALRTGLSPLQCHQAGFSASDCKNAGCSATDCRVAGYTAVDCKGAGFSAFDCWQAGYTLRDCHAASYDLKTCWYAGYLFSDARAAGYSALECKQAGCSTDKLRKEAGYSATECKEAGIPISALKQAGFSATECFAAGFALRDCFEDAGFSPADCKKAGFSATDFNKAGLKVATCASAGFRLPAIREAGYSALKCKIAGYSLTACRSAGYSLVDCKSGGFTFSQFREQGCSVADCRSAGFSAADCKRAEITIANCIDAGYSIADCKGGGYSAADCRKVGCSARTCKDVGYSWDDCIAAGFSFDERRTAGFAEAFRH